MINSVIFSMFLLLLQKRKVSRDYIAEKFEISKRTVSRHIDTLLCSGVPIISVQGRHTGGYMLSDDFKIDSLCFNNAEVKIMIDSLNKKDKTMPDNLISGIVDKLKTLNLQRSKYDSEIFLNEDKIIIDAGPWGLTHIFRGKIEALNKAINSKTTLLIKYIDRHELFSERKFDPYNLILKNGVWYVYGWCHRRGDFRLFKLSRINGIFPTESTFSIRPDADAREKLNVQFDSNTETDIIIEFHSLILSQIEEWLGFDAIYEEGLAYRAAATVYGGNELVAKLMSFGSSVRIISPPQLREEVLIECRRVLQGAEDYFLMSTDGEGEEDFDYEENETELEIASTKPNSLN